jgi:YesN/AraC family two-component response regulator
VPRLLLVEDEPSALRYLRAIIESRCTGFEVIDTAENGVEALEKARRSLPDVVITDIKMALMNGIELAARIGRELPFIYTVIVSGYQEFDYARRALNSGVVDYLLKPVNAVQLKRLLDSLGRRLAADYHAQRIELLRTVIAGASIAPWQIEKYLPFRRYSTALLRNGGLPSRSFAPLREHDVTDALAAAKKSLEEKDIWSLPGRDRAEVVFLYTPEHMKAESVRKQIVALAEARTEIFHTVLFHPGAFALEALPALIPTLYRALDSAVVIGHSQVLSGPADRADVRGGFGADVRGGFGADVLGGFGPRAGQVGAAVLDPGLGSRIDFLVSNALFTELEAELRKLFQAWEKEQRPQLWVEAYLRQVLHLVAKRSPRTGVSSSEDLELMLDDALRASATQCELAEKAWSLVAKIARSPTAPRHGTDIPDLLQAIEGYLRANYADTITLRSVCDTFAVSQTYLSRLFRRFEKTSFNDYLTTVRIDAAKRLMQENPLMPLKDVAAFVGYHDQFYFSRVFKSVTGVPPSAHARGATPGKS